MAVMSGCALPALTLSNVWTGQSRSTLAGIEYLFQQVAQFAFEQEYASKHDYVVTTDTFLQMIPRIRPSLTEVMIEDFQKDGIAYSRDRKAAAKVRGFRVVEYHLLSEQRRPRT
jgi:hypothetical protein